MSLFWVKPCYAFSPHPADFLIWFMVSPIVWVGQTWDLKDSISFFVPRTSHPINGKAWEIYLQQCLLHITLSFFRLPPHTTFQPTLFLFAWAKNVPQLFLSFSFSSSFTNSRWSIPNQSIHNTPSYVDRLSGLSFGEPLFFFFLKKYSAWPSGISRLCTQLSFSVLFSATSISALCFQAKLDSSVFSKTVLSFVPLQSFLLKPFLFPGMLLPPPISVCCNPSILQGPFQISTSCIPPRYSQLNVISSSFEFLSVSHDACVSFDVRYLYTHLHCYIGCCLWKTRDVS